MTILFSHATVLCMDEAGTVLQDGYVLVRGREIAYVGSIRPQERADREVNATGKVLMPGFVDAHTHLTMSLMREMCIRDRLFAALHVQIMMRAGERALVIGHKKIPP